MEDLIPDICREWKSYFASREYCPVHRGETQTEGLRCCCVGACKSCAVHRPIDFRCLPAQLQYAVRYYPSLCELATSSFMQDPSWRLPIHNLPETISKDYNAVLFNSNTLGQMISVYGVAICISDVVQLLVGMEFRCSKCGKIHFAKMPFPGIVSYPSTKQGDFEDATFSVPSSVKDTNTLGKWRAEIERLATSQTLSLHRQLMPYPRRALLHAKAVDSTNSNISGFDHRDAKCECIQKNKQAKVQGKFVPLPHRSVFIDAQIFKIRERRDEDEESSTEVVEDSSKGKKKGALAVSSASATAGSIDVLIVGERSVVPSLSPGTLVTVTGALTVANAVMELLKRGGVQKRIGQGMSSASNMPDIQHHPGDFTAGPKTVILMSSHVEIHKTMLNEEALSVGTQQLSPPGASFFEQCNFQKKRPSPWIERMSESVDLEKMLLNSFCPGIIGHKSIKLAILMCAVSDEPGVATAEPATHSELFDRSFMAQEGPPNTRGSAIHLLILGPAGIGKSQLLKFASLSLFRSVYLCGPTLTPAGLGVGWSAQSSNASSSATSHARLEAGALIVADGGLSCIDEIDKMSIPAQNVLYEVIDQGTLTVSKAAVLHTVTTSTRVIAAGNIENIGYLSPDVLSRFSLTFCIPAQKEGVQDPSRSRDEQSARRALLMSVLGSTGPLETQISGDRVPPSQGFEAAATRKAASETLSMDALRAYLHHLRRKPRPRVTTEAKNALKNWYIAQRSQPTCTQDGSRRLYETRMSPRKLGSVFEMTCCLAKIRGKGVVEALDVEDVISLVAEAESSSKITMQRSQGAPGGKRTRKNAMVEIFRNYLHKQKLSSDKQLWSELELQESYETCFQNDLSQSSQQMISFPKILDILNDSGILLKSSHSKYRMR